ncbi:HNH endonuclease [Phytobacter diazotrophicus]|uniref:HNH endonuclease n=1 Tax=Phytobacter diazotrophicus TaxID=395631 RepID=UPI002936A8C1|nr:HNH endonuclease [Phytobacter diazotrophicus]MDV2904930.1 HNH endonuclease [Phytobacter diazotrophicus]
MEIWKKTKYVNIEASNYGRVKNVQTGKIIGAIGNHGYYKTTIYGNYVLIHRLVAQTWIPNPNNLPVVNHIDENTLNNNISNLEWSTQSNNIKGTGAGIRKNVPLTTEQKDEVKQLRSTGMSFIKITAFMNKKHNRTTSRNIYTRICKK